MLENRQKQDQNFFRSILIVNPKDAGSKIAAKARGEYDPTPPCQNRNFWPRKKILYVNAFTDKN